MPRLFISHSSRDNIAALAFQNWLVAQGWSEDDIFIDLHDITAGDTWRDTLVKANIACDVLLFLASPDSLGSEECRREVRRAEDDRKDVLVAILRDVALDDPRLQPYADRQIVSLSAPPLSEPVEVAHQGLTHTVAFNAQELNSIHTALVERGHAPDSFVWPPKDRPGAPPYPGLDAFDEQSAGIFFGREADVMGAIRELRQMRHRGSPRLLVIQGASGAGKSSFLRAGLWPKLSRTAEFVPVAVVRPAKGVITGPHGLGKGFEAWFTAARRPRSAGSVHAELLAGDVAAGAARLTAYLAEAVALATEARSVGASADRAPARLSPLIAIDQGEELFAAEDAVESERFIAMLGHILASLPAGLDPFVLITIRADSLDALLQRVPKLGIDTPKAVPLAPLSPTTYRDVITRPAAVYSRRVARLDVDPELVSRLAHDATGTDALPLLAFTLHRLFDVYAKGKRLALADYETIGGIGGSIDRALAEARKAAGAAGTADHLRRLIVPGLATWDPAAGTSGAAKRLVAQEAELLGGKRAELKPLADALVANRLLTRGADTGGSTLEVAHEALLRRKPIDGWLAEQKDALKLRDDVLREAREWEGGGKHGDFVRRGTRLESALDLIGKPDFAAALAPAGAYLAAGRKQEAAGRRRARLVSASIMSLMALVIAGLTARMYEPELNGLWFQYATARPYLVTAEAALARKQADPFWDCAKTEADYSRHCPGMVVVPAGQFTMGSPDTYKNGTDTYDDRAHDEGPQRKVILKTPLAVAMHEVTFDQWDQCVAAGGCKTVASDSGWQRGRRPVINVNWNDAQEYVVWLSKMTGHTYRLLTEAEWEYAARAGSQARWSSGDDEEQLGDYAWFYSNSETKTRPAGKKNSNAFGLYDMHGNVYEWVQDCYVDNYKDAPTDGSAVAGKEDCTRIARGGSWSNYARDTRAANRHGTRPDDRTYNLGFRVARVLFPPRTP